MISARVNTDFRFAKDLKAGYLKAPALMKTGITRTGKRIGALMVKELRVQPARPKYKIRWQSERQRRAFFASDGFGKGIPYRRTDKLMKGWKVEIEPIQSGAGLILINRVPSAEFVQGSRMQRMHKASGYVPSKKVVAKYRPIFRKAIYETWRTVSQPGAGVNR